MRRITGALRDTRGMILTDFLLTMMIAIMLVPAVLVCLNVLAGSLQFNEEVQDMIAEAQIRHILLISSDKKIENGSLLFDFQNRSMNLSFVNDHLILQPGTQIIFSDIDSGQIESRNNMIYAIYTRNHHTYEKVIGLLQ